MTKHHYWFLLLQINDENAKLKEMNSILQQKIDSHVCIILVQADSEDPTNKLTKVMIELQIFENETKKVQRDYESDLKIIKSTERDLEMPKENVEK